MTKKRLNYGSSTHCKTGIHDLRKPGARGFCSVLSRHFCVACRDARKAARYAIESERRRRKAGSHDWASGFCPAGCALTGDNAVRYSQRHKTPFCYRCKAKGAAKAGASGAGKPKQAERGMSAADSDRYLELATMLEGINKCHVDRRAAVRDEMARIKQGVA